MQWTDTAIITVEELWKGKGVIKNPNTSQKVTLSTKNIQRIFSGEKQVIWIFEESVLSKQSFL